MTLRSRLARVERAAARPGAGLARHWERVWADREAGFIRFLESLPDSHRGRVLDAIGGTEAVAARLFVAGPTWAGEGAPAVAQWAWVRIDWGDGHPFNPALPEPVPAALLDLLLNHPDADIHGARCPGCRAFVPCSPYRRDPYRPPMLLARNCPICGAVVPPPPRC